MTLQEIIKTLREIKCESDSSKGGYYFDRLTWHGAGEIADALEGVAAEIAAFGEERKMLRVYCRDLMKQRDAALEKIEADILTAEERLTEEERRAVAGIALIVQRLKVYPEQLSRTHRDDVELLWEIAEKPFAWEEPSNE